MLNFVFEPSKGKDTESLDQVIKLHEPAMLKYYLIFKCCFNINIYQNIFEDTINIPQASQAALPTTHITLWQLLTENKRTNLLD